MHNIWTTLCCRGGGGLQCCRSADLQERAVAVLYPQSVVSAEAVGLCVDGADGEVLASEVLIAHTALCAGGTVHVSRRKQDSSGVWVPQDYPVGGSIGCVGDVCEDTVVMCGEHAVTINLVTTEVTPLPPFDGELRRMVLMPHHIVYCSVSSPSNAVHFRLRDNGAEVVVRVECKVQSLVAMRVTEAVLIGISSQIVQYSCEGVKMRTIDQYGFSFAVSPCETLLLTNHPAVVVHRLDTPELREVHRVDTGLTGASHFVQPLFSPDASLAVLSCGETVTKQTIRTIDIVSGKALCTLPNGGYISTAACFSACSRYLFVVAGWSVQQWDARSGAPTSTCTHIDCAWSMHASTDGCRLVVVGKVTSVLDIAAINMQVSEQDALQHGPPRPLPIPSPRESFCSGCVCS